jgi:rhamnosyl/mannosyltransferase
MPGHLARNPGDLYHLHFPNPTGELSWLAVRPRAPMVITYHGDVIRQKALMPFYSPFIHAVLGGANVIMPSSNNMILRSPFLQQHRDRCTVVPLGIDLEPFLRAEQHATEAAALRARYPGPIVLFVGRLVHYKGLHVLFEAMRTIEATLLVLGDGPSRAELERQSRELGLEKRVVFAGMISPDDIVGWMAAADIGVLPSILPNESFGLSMVELMACGIPVVCTELGTGTSLVNQHDESGFVVEPGNPVVLGAAITRLLTDQPLRRRMGVAARARAVRMFSTDAMMTAVKEIYAVAAERWRAARPK